ncbi:imelysin family protein [Ekhidna sp.]|uniref:imelysin family protein n=1 Tax=Ekhidna sp. TaxID=2608089 RepID=UPI0032969C19
MRKNELLLLFITLGLCAVSISCSEDNAVESRDNFDRESMLQNWADNIIMPGYIAYVSKLAELNNSVEAFTNSPSIENLSVARASWLSANTAWQKVAMFEIGKAEELSLINYTNIYPTNTSDLIQTIESGSYDLTSVNKQDEQGFPAIEYLIYGIRNTDQEIVDLYLQETANQPYKTYLIDLGDRLESMAQSVLHDWQNGYRETFIANSGSESTSSVNKLVNDYIFYYEKHLRAGKIGIPAGIFSSEKLPEKVEGYYSGKSKELFITGLDAVQYFFNGKSPDSNLTVEGEGLKSYLDFVNTVSGGEDLGALINAQFVKSKEKAEALSENFNTQVKTDNTLMLETYDELQKNVVNMKVDMLQGLNIRVDFVDADGD